ncbi:hypothetical protein P186_1001 [Pyrobaculum ferrireducens]|uniref:Uncharacterized protein n=1 Tax=Pyrobaculum ferrireducens TaxID=1104324 RepID=G7VBL0_9CREN|nr:hypothetical protein P186_1001 [Pyrobaculum ferrireducens]
MGKITLATDRRHSDRHIAHAANPLRQAKLPQSTTSPLNIKEAVHPNFNSFKASSPTLSQRHPQTQ